MTQRSGFNADFWFGQMKKANGNDGRIAVLHQTGILDHKLTSAREISVAVRKIKLICGDAFVCNPLVEKVMEMTLPGNGWHEYYHQVVPNNSTAIAIFVDKLTSGRHDLDRLGQVLLAINRSDLRALKTAWLDLGDGDCQCYEEEHIFRDFIICIACECFDPEIFAYLDEHVRFDGSLGELRRYWHKCIPRKCPQVFQAITRAYLRDLDAVISKSRTRKSFVDILYQQDDQKLLKSALDGCQDVSDLESPVYQILALVVQVLHQLNRDHLFPEEFGPLVTDPQAKGIIVWCLGQPIKCLRDPYQVINQARATSDPELLTLTMQSFEISTSDLMEWCDENNDHDSSWFGTVLNAKSARSG